MASVPPFPPGYLEDDLGPRTVAVASVFIALEIGIVALRFATRILYKLQYGIDDYLIIPALIFTLGTCIISIVEVNIAGVGRHLAVLYVINPQAVVNWAKCGYAIECIYFAAIALPKLSILASYLRIFTNKRLRATTYLVGFIVAGNGTAGIITSLSSCRPFSARWDPDLFVSNCIDAPRFWQGVSFPNVITDFIMLLLPLPVIWSLQMDLKQKLALSGIFLLGSFGMVSSIIRLTVTFRVTALSDGTWDSADIAMWSLIEAGCYLIAACLPALRPLYITIINKASNTISSLVGRTHGSGTSWFKRSRSYYGENNEEFAYVDMEAWQRGSSADQGQARDRHYYPGDGNINPNTST